MKFKQDVLHKIIIQKTIGVIVIMLVFITLCSLGFKDVLKPYSTPLIVLVIIWLISAGFMMFKAESNEI